MAGNSAYEDILNCFERIGQQLTPEINKYFSGFDSYLVL
ncbi:MAG TPA: hypothetical protein IGQ44_10890 [Geminocystis sp. M7585_C2015_104]|nr:hypothetical protein [Geminocystis sp. M7585_C2015_104]